MSLRWPRLRPTPPPVAQALPPGAGRLVYQGFWPASPQGEPIGKDWFGSPTWSGNYGALVNSGQDPTPTFAYPNLPDTVQRLLNGGDYLVVARISAGPNGKTPGLNAFGVTVRDSTGQPPLMPEDHGMWRGGIAMLQHAFITAEVVYPNSQVPAELTASKAVAIAAWRPNQPDVVLRFEARGHRYTLSVDNALTLQVDDDRFPGGNTVGVWTDRTQIAVKDFRIYSLAQ